MVEIGLLCSYSPRFRICPFPAGYHLTFLIADGADFASNLSQEK